ncbi:hypothetical protein HU200_033209 [Digitaria exilis]|uniref:Uncharacterized protein n=1 Tax=Digitaria exilis TaxID=1010633 RepID=A0A835ENK9_9POAL|nr:hypothetical protein HU200_033209 [Digitaria exilis]
MLRVVSSPQASLLARRWSLAARPSHPSPPPPLSSRQKRRFFHSRQSASQIGTPRLRLANTHSTWILSHAEAGRDDSVLLRLPVRSALLSISTVMEPFEMQIDAMTAPINIFCFFPPPGSATIEGELDDELAWLESDGPAAPSVLPLHHPSKIKVAIASITCKMFDKMSSSSRPRLPAPVSKRNSAAHAMQFISTCFAQCVGEHAWLLLATYTLTRCLLSCGPRTTGMGCCGRVTDDEHAMQSVLDSLQPDGASSSRSANLTTDARSLHLLQIPRAPQRVDYPPYGTSNTDKPQSRPQHHRRAPSLDMDPDEIRQYTSGRVERLHHVNPVPASLDAATGVTSKDATIDAATGLWRWESTRGMWALACGGAAAAGRPGPEDARANPLVEGAPSLRGLGCGRVLVCLAEDALVAEGKACYDALRESGWLAELLDSRSAFHELLPPPRVSERQGRAPHGTRLVAFVAGNRYNRATVVVAE